MRQCERPGRRLLFLPAHPRRRWCSSVCGNRVRVGRYYDRHKPRRLDAAEQMDHPLRA